LIEKINQRTYEKLNDLSIENSPESVALLDRTLGHKWYTIIVLSALLPNTVPMDCRLHTLHMVLHIDDNTIVFAHLDTGTGDHTIGGEDTAFHTIG
jgi:hypothetical protein